MDDQITRRGPFDTGPISSEPGPVASGERDARFDNNPPLEERIVMDFMEELQLHGADEKSIAARIDELLASARRAPEEIKDQEIAGKPVTGEKIAGGMGDLCKQARDVAARLETARDKHNRPLLNAQRALKARADGLISPLLAEIAKLRKRLDDHAAAEDQRRRDEERRAAEARRIAEEAAAAALTEQGMEDQIEHVAPPAPVAAPPTPIARGDYGSRVGTRTVYEHEIESVRKLPDRLLKHPKIIEALDKLIAAEIKRSSGKCKIPGVRLWPVTKAAVR
jgi:hypothetical protein